MSGLHRHWRGMVIVAGLVIGLVMWSMPRLAESPVHSPSVHEVFSSFSYTSHTSSPPTLSSTTPSSSSRPLSSQSTLSSSSQSVAPTPSWSCGMDVTDARNGMVYPTVRIGADCWMTKNMNIGVTTTGPSDGSCAAIEKYCYGDDPAQCDIYGGLYVWSEAMCGASADGARGICPAGWHVSTHAEWTALEQADGASSLKGLLGGYRDLQGNYGYRAAYANFWTSTQSGEQAFFRDIASDYVTIGGGTENVLLGFSVRCVQD